jgi:hypothetical protein
MTAPAPVPAADGDVVRVTSASASDEDGAG